MSIRSLGLTPVLLLLAQLAVVSAQPVAAPEPLRYTLSFPAPHTHYVDVEVTVPTGRRAQIELLMPVWTPGSYLVREYEKHVERVSARTPDGRPLAVDKTRKNRWRVDTGGAPTVVFAYSVYAREMGVRSDWVEREFAMLNGAATFVTLAEKGPRPHDVELKLPAEWRQAISPMQETAPHQFRAPDFDSLVDSPIVAGNPAVHDFDVDGVPHRLVNQGEGGVWDAAASVRDVEAITREHARLWGSIPYDRYVFFNMLTETGGGLEHKSSTMLMASRWATRTRRGYLNWLELASHEHFHAWNVKRLRPVELGPFDYDNENYTRALWIAEGFTQYYGPLTVRRAGLSSTDEYLESLSREIDDLQTTPGRLVQSAEMASYDAWVKEYRPDENTINSAISYYTKGAVVAFLLDARVRRATGGQKTLDDVMRAAYQRFSGTTGFTDAEFFQLASAVAGTDLVPWFHDATQTTGELQYTEALDWLGLRFRPADPPSGDKAGKGWLGLTFRNDNGRLVITRLTRGTPAYDSGLNVDDEILAIDDYRVRADRLNERLEDYRPGDRVSVLVARRDHLERMDVTLGAEPAKAWRLEPDPAATPEQRAHLAAWLK